VPGALDEKHVDLETDQFMSQSREPVEFVISISILESYVFALNIIKLMEKPYNFVALEAMLAAVPPNSHPILGNFGGCCASAGMESANTISTTRNRSGIGPPDRSLGIKHCYSETPALVSSPKELLR
jgi:hypothetical protein